MQNELVEIKHSTGDSCENILEHALETKEHGGRVRGVRGVNPSRYFNTGKGKNVDKDLLARQEKLIMAQELRLRKLEEEIFSNKEGKGSCSTKAIRPTLGDKITPIVFGLIDDEDDKSVVNKDGDVKTFKKKKMEDEVTMPRMDPTNMPENLYQLYGFLKVQGSAGVVTIPLDKSVFGYKRALHIHLEDVVPFCQLKPISYTAIVVYIWYLHNTFHHKMVDEIRFVDPYGIGHQHDNNSMDDAIENRARSLFKGLDGTKEDQICVAPCNVGEHWILTLIDPHKQKVCLLDPYYDYNHDQVWKALKLFIAKADMGVQVRKNISWTTIKVPKQPDTCQCGFYVLRYMLDIVQFNGITNTGMIQSVFINKMYNKKDIDDVRKDWASCVWNNIFV